MIRTGKSSSTGSSRRAERERLLDEEEDGYSTEGQKYIEILEDDEESYEEPPRQVYVRGKDGSLKSAKRGSRYCGGKWRRKYCSFPRMRSRGDGGDMPMYGGPETYQDHPAFLNPSAGLHYSYVIVMALLLSTVVQLSRGGLLAYEQKKDPHDHDHHMHPNYTQHGFSNIRGSNNLNAGYYGNWGNHMMMGNMGSNMNNNGMVPMMRGNTNDFKMNEDDSKNDTEGDQKKIEKDDIKSNGKKNALNAGKDSFSSGEDVDEKRKESSQMASVTQLMNNPIQNSGMDSVMQSMNNPQSSNNQASSMNMQSNVSSPQNMNNSMQSMPPNASSPQNMNNSMQSMPPNASSPQNMNNSMQSMPSNASSPQNMNNSMQSMPPNASSPQNMNNSMQSMPPNASSPNINSLSSADQMVQTMPGNQSIPAVPNAPTANAAAALAMTPVTPTSPETETVSTISTSSSLPELPPPAPGSQSVSLPSIPPPEPGTSSSFFASPDSTAVNHKKVDIPATLDPNDSLPLLNNYRDTWDPWDPSDVPMFFHIPKSGGSSIKDIMGTCHRFTLASEFGVTDGHINDTEIAVVYPKIGVKGAFLSPFVNIDATTIPGINRAISMGFPASNHLADVVVSPYLYEANDLFTPTSKGRLFSVFRHPNERSLSLFYYLQYADWEPTYDPALKDWTVGQYAMSEKFENNWLTRQLTNELEGELTDAHLQMAIEVLRRKFLVGLMSRMEETMTRFERFFRWKYIVSPATQETCRQDLIHGKVNSNTKNKHDKPKEGSEEWNLLSEQNNFDLQLYAYVESLFDEQEAFVADIPVNIRLDQSTCCMCEPATFSPDGRKCPVTIQEE